jgi:pimeloyl-ACP methyl ester carboxylesterase
MIEIRRGYVDSTFGQVHYRIAFASGGAAGIPLLCLHQTPANGSEWLPVMEPLAQGRTVIAMDTPGYGMSDPPPAPATIEDFAQVADSLMQDLAEAGLIAAGPYDAMGIHTGSVIATELARRLPERVRRLVLFGLAAYPQDVRDAKLANLANAFPPPGMDLAHVEKLWSIIGVLSDPRIPYEERHVNMAECLRLGSRMPWGYSSVYRYDFLAAMAQVDQPVLVMNPEDDLCEVTRATSHLFRNGRRMDITGVKHGVLKLERDLVVAAIEDFLGVPE